MFHVIELLQHDYLNTEFWLVNYWSCDRIFTPLRRSHDSTGDARVTTRSSGEEFEVWSRHVLVTLKTIIETPVWFIVSFSTDPAHDAQLIRKCFIDQQKYFIDQQKYFHWWTENISLTNKNISMFNRIYFTVVMMLPPNTPVLFDQCCTPRWGCNCLRTRSSGDKIVLLCVNQSETSITWRQFVIKPWEIIPRAPQKRVGSVRFWRRYTPKMMSCDWL